MDALNDYIIIVKDKNDFVTKSGIYVPDFAARSLEVGEPYTGVICSIGELVSNKYRIGDRVLFSDVCNPYGVFDSDNDETLLFIRECDIVAVLNEN